jgi:hypothetical protein
MTAVMPEGETAFSVNDENYLIKNDKNKKALDRSDIVCDVGGSVRFSPVPIGSGSLSRKHFNGTARHFVFPPAGNFLSSLVPERNNP